MVLPVAGGEGGAGGEDGAGPYGEGDSFIALNPNQDVALTPAK